MALLAWPGPGGNLAAVLTGAPTVGFGGGVGLVADLIRGGEPTGVWPAVEPVLLWTSMLVVAAIAGGIGYSVRRLARRGRPGGSSRIGDLGSLAALTEAERRRAAVRLRPSLATGREVTARDLGLRVGRFDREVLWSGLEDTVTSIMPPPGGEDVGLAVPQIIDAPGPVVATSNKADLVSTTRLRRERDGSTCWVFDPEQVVHEPCGWFWNPLSGVATFEDAQNLAGMFVPKAEEAGGRNQYFVDRSRDYLTYLLLAAAASSEPTLADVDRWLDDNRSLEPQLRLREAGPELADATRALGRYIAEDSRETIEGVYSSARTATSCLKSRSIMEWVTPGRGRQPFDPTRFVTSTDTLYLCSRGEQISAAPLTAAMVDRIFTAARKQGERRAGGRLDPPLVAVLDEAANIVKIPSLPANYSYFGSLGILVHAIFQSMGQIRSVRGRSGAEQLWGASTVKLIGPGIDDAELAGQIARFMGHHEVTTTSVSHGGRMGGSLQISATREPVWDEGQVRGFGRGQALLLATGARPAVIDLAPWYEGPDRDQLAADVRTYETALTDRARTTIDASLDRLAPSDQARRSPTDG
jgi:type IV secretory pathway TraG/TraD family ATPase VirD4